MKCPHCGENQLIFIGEAVDDDEIIGNVYECLECDRQSLDLDDGGSWDGYEAWDSVKIK